MDIDKWVPDEADTPVDDEIIFEFEPDLDMKLEPDMSLADIIPDSSEMGMKTSR